MEDKNFHVVEEEEAFFKEIMAKFLLLHCAGRLLSQLSLENSVGIVSCCNVSIEANPFLT